jgi:hypothetical protein
LISSTIKVQSFTSLLRYGKFPLPSPRSGPSAPLTNEPPQLYGGKPNANDAKREKTE